MSDRLPTALWVQAHIRQCSAQGIGVYVLRKGEAESGMVVLKVNQPGGNRLYSQSRDLNGRLGWLAGLGGALVDERQAGEYIDRQVRRDPDIWVVEVESRDGSHPFEGPMI